MASKIEKGEIRLYDAILLTFCKIIIYEGTLVATTTIFSTLTHKHVTENIFLPKNLSMHKIGIFNTTLANLIEVPVSGSVTGWVTKPQLSYDGKHCLLALVDPSIAGYIKTSAELFKQFEQVLTKDLQQVTINGILHTKGYTFHLDEIEWKITLANQELRPYFIADTDVATCNDLFCTIGLLIRKYDLKEYKSRTGSYLPVLFKIGRYPMHMFAHTYKDKSILQTLINGAYYQIYFVKRKQTQYSMRLELTPFTIFKPSRIPKTKSKTFFNATTFHHKLVSSSGNNTLVTNTAHRVTEKSDHT